MSAKDTTDDKPGLTEISYRVTVTKIVKNLPFRNREYKVIGEIPDPESRDGLKNEYGYVYFDDAKDVETIVYKQELPQVELPEIIKAVNGLDG